MGTRALRTAWRRVCMKNKSRIKDLQEQVHRVLEKIEDEILKDADVIDHSLSDPAKAVKEHEKERFAKPCEETGIQSIGG